MKDTINRNPKIAKLYEGVPEESLNRLVAFRERFPYQTISIQGQSWNYIDTHQGEAVLFLFAGASAIAEVSFQSIEHFAQRYRVIAPDYPPIRTLEDLFAGVMLLLDQLGIADFFLMGGSYGGWMAQSFVRSHPERIGMLVITAVGPPNPENSQQIAKMLPWFRFAPTFLLKALLNRAFGSLESTNGDDPDMSLLWALAKEAVNHRMSRADLFALMERLLDQTDNYEFRPDDLNDWPGSMLLVFGSEDPATPQEKRDAMVELYPQAELKVFEGGEHGIAITHQREYFAVIDEFLAR